MNNISCEQRLKACTNRKIKQETGEIEYIRGSLFESLMLDT